MTTGLMPTDGGEGGEGGVEARPPVVDRFKESLLIAVLSVLTTVNYVLPNVRLVLKYSEAAENDRYVRMTLAYIIAPIFITSLINLAWYLDDDLRDKDEGRSRAKPATWCLRALALTLQMGTVLRLSESLWLSYRGKRSVGGVKADYNRRAACQQRDGTLLKSFTNFMQGVPQFVLQLYIMLQVTHPSIEQDGVLWQLLSLGGSLGGIVWATVSCDRILSSKSAEEAPMDWLGLGLLMPWRLFSIASRLTVLALFSTLFPVYFGLGCVAHYLLMFALIQRQKVARHNQRRGEVFLFLVGGLVFIVTDLLVKYERSFHKYLLYYGVALLENACMLVLWYVYADYLPSYHKMLFCLGVTASFFVGLVFLRIYYEYSHPQTVSIFGIKFCCQKQPLQ